MHVSVVPMPHHINTFVIFCALCEWSQQRLEIEYCIHEGRFYCCRDSQIILFRFQNMLTTTEGFVVGRAIKRSLASSCVSKLCCNNIILWRHHTSPSFDKYISYVICFDICAIYLFSKEFKVDDVWHRGTIWHLENFVIFKSYLFICF